MSSVASARILVVDDEPYIREIVAFDLKRRGYEVLEAGSGNAALKVLAGESIDLVVSDVRMPDGNGVDLLQALRLRDAAHPPLLFMTAFADISSDIALHMGATAFLTKPIARDNLLDAVTEALVPQSKRWLTDASSLDGAQRVDLSESDEPTSSQHLSRVALGQGGMFMELDTGFPKVHEIVAFTVVSGDERLGTLTGFGRVRWVRYEDIEGLPAGIGLEFVHLQADSCTKIIQFLATERPSAFIPLGVQVPDSAFRRGIV